MAVPASRNGVKMKRLFSTLFLIFVALFTGCSSGEAVTGDSYYFETDDQYYIKKFPTDIATIAKSKDGYYFFGGPDYNYLYYMDNASMKPVLLCNKPNCLHYNETDSNKVSECNAYFCPHGNLFYYKSSLYVIGQTSQADSSEALFQVSLDGAKRKKLVTFKNYVYNMIIHRGSIYYIVNDSASQDTSSSVSKSILYRIHLNDTAKAPELLFECEGVSSILDNLLGYGDSLYFRHDFFEDEDMETEKQSIYRIDYSGKCESIIDDACHFVFYQNTIIYSDTDMQVYNCGLDGSKVQKMNGLAGFPMGVDKNYIYLSTGGKDERIISAYDWNANEVSSYDFPPQSICLGVDEKYLFIEEFGNESGLYSINVSKIADKTATITTAYKFDSSEKK